MVKSVKDLVKVLPLSLKTLVIGVQEVLCISDTHEARSLQSFIARVSSELVGEIAAGDNSYDLHAYLRAFNIVDSIIEDDFALLAWSLNTHSIPMPPSMDERIPISLIHEALKKVTKEMNTLAKKQRKVR